MKLSGNQFDRKPTSGLSRPEGTLPEAPCRLNQGALGGSAERLAHSQGWVFPVTTDSVDQCRKHLLWVCCPHWLPLFLMRIHYFHLEYYPLSVFSPCGFCGVSPIPSCRWTGDSGLRQSECHFLPFTWLVHTTNAHVIPSETLRLCWNGRREWFLWGCKARSRDGESEKGTWWPRLISPAMPGQIPNFRIP